METTVTKRLTGVQMVKVFNENSFIRNFETKRLRNIEDLHHYHITIRHSENEDPLQILETALKN